MADRGDTEARPDAEAIEAARDAMVHDGFIDCDPVRVIDAYLAARPSLLELSKEEVTALVALLCDEHDVGQGLDPHEYTAFRKLQKALSHA